MFTLRQALEAMPHRDVRAVATRLAVRRRDEHRKELWIARIVEAWSLPQRQAQLLAALSPAARQAAARLARAGSLPARLFLAEYGSVRRPRPGQRSEPDAAADAGQQPPPWEAPATLSEELYYCGLLAPAEAVPLEKARRLALPADLQPLFAQDAGAAQSAVPWPAEEASGLLLLHDLAQTFCFLLEETAQHRATISLLQGRWLPPAGLNRLNSRLLSPDPVPLPRSHARCRRLRFLFFLAAAAGLLLNGSLTPSTWAWLAEPAEKRWLWLWNAWRTAPAALRRAYRQPTATLPEPWPDLALRHIGDLPAAFTAADLAQVTLGREAAFTAFFTAHLADLSALDAATADLLDTLATDWGILATTAGSRSTCGLTSLGRWLFDPTHDAGLAPWPAALTSPAGRLEIPAVAARDEPREWQLSLSPWAPALPLAQLAPYVVHARLVFADPPCHTYRLAEETVATAAALGHGLPTLLEALAGLGIVLSPEQQAVLRAWHEAGHELQLLVLPVLRATRPELLARLLQYADVREGLGELLAPTIAVAALPPAELAARLRAAGYYLQGAGVREQRLAVKREKIGDRNQGTGATEIGVRRTEADSAADRQFVIGNPQSIAALWLAGQLYAALGEHISLPLPPAFGALDALLASLAAADQAIVQAQWERLREELMTALDGRTFAPPPQPTDPERWRPLIEAAIADGRSLTMRYFTAGRNVLTERTVTPHWIEEHRGIPYLRADCHLAGRILLFRLDRIQELRETRGEEDK